MSGFELVLEDGRLGLKDLENPKLKPLVVDFLAPALQRRVRLGLPRREPLARALALDRGLPSVFDATAGLGVDAFIMAAAGCRVRSMERSQIVYQLLQDGLRRLSASGSAIADRLQFELGDSIEQLRKIDDRPDIIYVDPMYPAEGHSSALPKKGMQMFRRLIGEDLDVDALIKAARGTAGSRVVVKRPLSASILEGARHRYEGKTVRYDVFTK